MCTEFDNPLGDLEGVGGHLTCLHNMLNQQSTLTPHPLLKFLDLSLYATSLCFFFVQSVYSEHRINTYHSNMRDMSTVDFSYNHGIS